MVYPAFEYTSRAADLHKIASLMLQEVSRLGALRKNKLSIEAGGANGREETGKEKIISIVSPLTVLKCDHSFR